MRSRKSTYARVSSRKHLEGRARAGVRKLCTMDEKCVVVFDCECDTGFGEVFGCARDEIIERFMQFTCICALLIPTRVLAQNVPADEVIQQSKRMTWWRDVSTDKRSTPVDSLLELFDEAELIVGFNCLAFDFRLIRRFYGNSAMSVNRYIQHRSKCLDIMTRVRDVTEDYFKLDKLLKDNGLSAKTGDGSLAIAMWQQGQRDELESYCASDVELTARLGLLDSMRVVQKCKINAIVLPECAYGLRSALRCKAPLDASVSRC